LRKRPEESGAAYAPQGFRDLTRHVDTSWYFVFGDGCKRFWAVEAGACGYDRELRGLSAISGSIVWAADEWDDRR